MPMKKRSRIFIAVACICAVSFLSTAHAFSQEHIRKLDGVRTSMTGMGNKLPELIKNSQPEDFRTLERLYEINNYALVTIESYLKMIRIMVSSGGSINKDSLTVLNGWLKFIKHYCEYDLKYFDEVIADTKDAGIQKIVAEERANVMELKNISEKGMNENIEIANKI